MTLAEFEKYAKEHNIFYCTKEVAEQIRTEIEAYHMGDSSNVCVKAWNEAIEKVLQIIDRYAEKAKGGE